MLAGGFMGQSKFKESSLSLKWGAEERRDLSFKALSLLLLSGETKKSHGGSKSAKGSWRSVKEG